MISTTDSHKEKKRFYYQTGVVSNKVYKQSMYVKDSGVGGFEGVEFLGSIQNTMGYSNVYIVVLAPCIAITSVGWLVSEI